MKIAILNKYQNKVNRGAETFVASLSAGLSKIYDVDVISDINYLEIFKQKYDVIIPTNGRLQSIFIRLLTWLTGAKMVISGQSGPGFDDRANLYTFPDVFVGLTNFQSDWAKKINPSVKVTTIPNGVDLKLFRDSKENRKKNTILSVGAFTNEKRHGLTIEAVSKMQNTKLIIVGDGGELKEEIFQKGLNTLGPDRFEIRSVRHSDMPQIYNSADVFAFPTVPWESFGIAMVEAMAAGLPVVATDDPIRREIVGEAGILVNPLDTEKYCKALTTALSKSWNDLPRTQAERFSWDKVSKEYEKLFENINS